MLMMRNTGLKRLNELYSRWPRYLMRSFVPLFCSPSPIFCPNTNLGLENAIQIGLLALPHRWAYVFFITHVWCSTVLISWMKRVLLSLIYPVSLVICMCVCEYIYSQASSSQPYQYILHFCCTNLLIRSQASHPSPCRYIPMPTLLFTYSAGCVMDTW